MFLFNAGKLFADVEPLAKTLILIKKNPQANITLETLETWILEFQQYKYYTNFGSELIYKLTKAILALYHMHQLDDKGAAIEKLKKLTFKENAPLQTGVIDYLSFFFNNQEFHPELGAYFLNYESPLPKQNVAEFILKLIKYKVLPIPINFEEFMKYAVSLCNEPTNKHWLYFQEGLLGVLNHTLFQQNLVKQEIKNKLFQAAISLIQEPEAQPYLNSMFVSYLLELYLFSLHFEIPKSLNEIAAHFNYNSYQMEYKIHAQFSPLIKVYQLSSPLIKQVVTIILQRQFSNEDFEKLMFMAKIAPEKIASDFFSELIKNADQENFLKIMQQIEVFNELYLNEDKAENSDDEDSDTSFHL